MIAPAPGIQLLINPALRMWAMLMALGRERSPLAGKSMNQKGRTNNCLMPDHFLGALSKLFLQAYHMQF
jgi:hypothetical protein